MSHNNVMVDVQPQLFGEQRSKFATIKAYEKQLQWLRTVGTIVQQMARFTLNRGDNHTTDSNSSTKSGTHSLTATITGKHTHTFKENNTAE
jgi:hypothetical protein